MTDQLQTVEAYLLSKATPTFADYYNGKMSYKLHGKSWEDYVAEAFPDISGMTTSENIYKSIIDLYAENLVPVPEELRGFSNILVPLLSRGEAPVVVDSAGTPHFAEHYEMVSDGLYTVAALYTRSIKEMQDYVTFVNSDGTSRLFTKDVPDDFTAATKEGYQFHEEKHGNELFRFALDDKGFGAGAAALQDRTNHSIIDQTVIAEMYARPFWYLMNVQMPPKNPYLQGPQPESDALQEQDTDGASGRIFTTSSEGPFGQLDPPTIGDMIGYHDSIIDKIPQQFGIPAHYLKPGTGTPPTGVALKVLSKRFNNRVSRMRDDLTPELERLADHLGLEKTVEVEPKKTAKRSANGQDVVTQDAEPEFAYELWNTSDDLLQESLDAHGISLSQMGYPLGYIAEVVTPGVDLDDYADEDMQDPIDKSQLGEPTDMTAAGQTGLPATPGQVASYAANPGQRKAAK